MRVVPGKYTLDSFMETLVQNTDKVFGTGGERKWLKTHLLFTRSGWQDFFKPFGLERWGDIWHFSIPESATSSVDFYAYQWDENLIACFTAHQSS